MTRHWPIYYSGSGTHFIYGYTVSVMKPIATSSWTTSFYYCMGSRALSGMKNSSMGATREVDLMTLYLRYSSIDQWVQHEGLI